MDIKTESDGRGENSSEATDSVTVIPDFTTDGWDDAIDVNFGFSG